jgi:hypothetical protein
LAGKRCCIQDFNSANQNGEAFGIFFALLITVGQFPEGVASIESILRNSKQLLTFTEFSKLFNLSTTINFTIRTAIL